MSGLEPGFQLGHYRITRSLGSGGMADVYEAHDDHLERTVALKVLPIEYCRNPQLVQRFHKEVRAAAKLNHRNIVTVYEVGQHENYHFFSMRLLTGGDLRRRIEQGLSPIESLAILRELADAFAHAHARNFVHRDVKPENVMFDEQGFPVLTDFGIAKALDANTHMTRTGMTMGTPRYLSPEQASGKPVDARADLYSLGVMFFEMLTGRPPYDAEESMAVIFKHVTEPIPTLPPDFMRYQPLLEKLMAKDPAKRIPSAVELIREIDAIVPRQPTGELKQSQLRTAENPLIANLMTPSPLRTPPPQTPRPVTPRPATPAPVTPAPSTRPPTTVVRDVTGEVALRVAPPVARKTVQPQPAVAPPPQAAPAPPPAAAPAKRGLGGLLGAVAMTGGLAVAAYTSYQALKAPGAGKAEPAATAVPAAPAPKTATEAGAPPAADAARQDAEARARADAEARRRNEADATRRKAAQDAQAKQQADAEAQRRAQAAAEAEAQRRAQAEADAKRRAEAEAETRRRAEAESEALRRAEAEGEARRRAEAEARRRAEAEEAARRKAAEQEQPPAESALSAEEIERRAREADRQKAAARARQEPERKKPREQPQQKQPQQQDPAKQEEEEALERARSAPGF